MLRTAMSKIPLQRVLSVVRDFDTFGGASPELAAWELSVEVTDIANAWREATEQGLLARTDAPDHTEPNEDFWRLTDEGWARLGVNPLADRGRSQTIAELKILDRIEDPALQALTRLTAHVTGARCAAIHVFDARYQHRIVAVNAPVGAHPAHDAMCRQVVDGREAIIVSDATTDVRFAASSFIALDPPVRFYASAPLRIAHDGAVIGTLCAFDSVTRELDVQQVERLHDLAHVAMSQIETRRIALGLGRIATGGLTG